MMHDNVKEINKDELPMIPASLWLNLLCNKPKRRNVTKGNPIIASVYVKSIRKYFSVFNTSFREHSQHL